MRHNGPHDGDRPIHTTPNHTSYPHLLHTSYPHLLSTPTIYTSYSHLLSTPPIHTSYPHLLFSPPIHLICSHRRCATKASPTVAPPPSCRGRRVDRFPLTPGPPHPPACASSCASWPFSPVVASARPRSSLSAGLGRVRGARAARELYSIVVPPVECYLSVYFHPALSRR